MSYVILIHSDAQPRSHSTPDIRPEYRDLPEE